MEVQKENSWELQWHPAFFAELQVELKADALTMQFENEHQLGTKPKEIDVLIIRKDTDKPVQKNIGRIFRKHNIVKYKSPTDYLSVDDFYKVYAYACLYKVDVEKTDSIPIDDITITFVCYKYPRKLFKHLREERHFHIENVEPGIYYIHGDVIPLQLILVEKLSDTENLWLRSLTNKLPDNGIVNRLIEDYEKNKDNNLYKSVMDTIVRANKEKFGGNTMCDALEEIFEELYRNRLDAEVAQIAEEKAQQMAEEKAQQIAEEKAQQIAEEKAQQIAEEKAQQMAEEKAQQMAEEKAQQIAEEKVQNLGKLISILLQQGRLEDVNRAVTSIACRQKLYKEFNLPI